MKRRMPLVELTVVVIAVAVLGTGLPWGSNVTVGGVKPGMKRAQVEELLGKPLTPWPVAEGHVKVAYRKGVIVAYTEQDVVSDVHGCSLESNGRILADIACDSTVLEQRLGPAHRSAQTSDSRRLTWLFPPHRLTIVVRDASAQGGMTSFCLQDSRLTPRCTSGTAED